MKKIFKNKERKKVVFAFLLGLFLASVVGVGATTLLYSSDIVYDNTASGLS